MEQAQERALCDAVLDQEAQEAVSVAPSQLDTVQALRGLSAINLKKCGKTARSRPRVPLSSLAVPALDATAAGSTHGLCCPPQLEAVA